jgi:sulfoxide reductase catalytic subunit YedY
MVIINRQPNLKHSDVTPRSHYLNRRRFLGSLAGAGIAATAGAETRFSGLVKSPFSTTEKPTPFDSVTKYNNFYEFGTGKDQPAQLAKNFRTSPWTVVIEGEVAKPRMLDLDAILKLAPLEERIYRHRCVEGWSMVIPWIGLPLAALIKLAAPTANAKYVAFQSYYDSRQMPQARYGGIPFPYAEGLRLDEAMNSLALLAVGLYGDTLPNQNGAPLRLVVPWKYGFKSIKSIVRIRFSAKQPPTTWSSANAAEYGFYSNVNPRVDHPRWSQAKERRVGEFFKRDTLLFNGYGDQVATLYGGMDLRKEF